jgi:MIP family channel proteins
MVGATGHISGGAFNPAVVVALAIARKLDPLRAVGYVAAQLLGGVLAALVVRLAFPAALTDAVRLGVPSVGSGFSTGNAFVAEVVATFFLAYVIFGVAVDKRGAATIAALLIGLCISMDILAIGPVSGGAMNPARWFGPAVVQGQFDNAWIWMVAPLLGAAVAAVVYFYGYLRGRAEPS